jgi:DNA-binding CsgD family transcriptional regulator
MPGRLSVSVASRLAVNEEAGRRKRLREAIVAVLVRDEEGRVSPFALRVQLANLHGGRFAKLPTFAELCSGVAVAGGRVSSARGGDGVRRRHFRGVRLRQPGRGEVVAARAAWEERLEEQGLGQVPLIRRICDPDQEGMVLEVDTADCLPETGMVYRAGGGNWRQFFDVDSVPAMAPTRNPDGTRGRRRRFISYLERLRAYVDETVLKPEDRHVLELVLEGRSIRDIAVEMDLTRWKVQDIVQRHQRAGGIAGPGPGRTGPRQ